MDSISRFVAKATFTIASGTDTSNAIGVEDFSFGSIYIPTTTNAITVQVSIDGTNWSALTDVTGTAKDTYASGDGNRVLYNEAFHFAQVRLVSAANEGADRTFPALFKG